MIITEFIFGDTHQIINSGLPSQTKCNLVEFSIKHGADANKQYSMSYFENGVSIEIEGQTCLHTAVESGNIKLVRTLLKNGADPNIAKVKTETSIKVNYYGKLAENPIDIAIRLNNPAMVAELIKASPDIGKSRIDNIIMMKLSDTDLINLLQIMDYAGSFVLLPNSDWDKLVGENKGLLKNYTRNNAEKVFVNRILDESLPQYQRDVALNNLCSMAKRESNLQEWVLNLAKFLDNTTASTRKERFQNACNWLSKEPLTKSMAELVAYEMCGSEATAIS